MADFFRFFYHLRTVAHHQFVEVDARWQPTPVENGLIISGCSIGPTFEGLDLPTSEVAQVEGDVAGAVGRHGVADGDLAGERIGENFQRDVRSCLGLLS